PASSMNCKAVASSTSLSWSEDRSAFCIIMYLGKRLPLSVMDFPVSRTCALQSLYQGEARISLTRRPGHESPAQQMDMQVIHGLPAVRAGVDHQAETLAHP